MVGRLRRKPRKELGGKALLVELNEVCVSQDSKSPQVAIAGTGETAHRIQTLEAATELFTTSLPPSSFI